MLSNIYIAMHTANVYNVSCHFTSCTEFIFFLFFNGNQAPKDLLEERATHLSVMEASFSRS